MSALREKILKALAGSSSQDSVRLDHLRKLAEPICDDLQQLYDLLDQLYSERLVNRASGYKDGKQFVGYWLVGAIQAPIPFRISTPAPPAATIVRRIATPEQAAAKLKPTTAKVQPNTAISPFPKTQEKPMGHPSNNVRDNILNMITRKPGIKQTDLIEYALVEHPDSTEKQIRKTVENLIHSAKKVRYEGIRAERTLFPNTEAGKPAAAAPPQAPAAPAKAKPQKSKNPTAAPAPVTAKYPAAFDPEYSFAFGVRKDGGVAICKDGISVVLARSEVQTILAHTTQE